MNNLPFNHVLLPLMIANIYKLSLFFPLSPDVNKKKRIQLVMLLAHEDFLIRKNSLTVGLLSADTGGSLYKQ